MTPIGSIETGAAPSLSIPQRGSSPDFPVVGSASRSATALHNVEQSIARHESWFGRERLIRLIGGVPAADLEGHVDHYRQVIRTRSWPNESRPTPLATFIDEYERAALAYVGAGFQALIYVEDPTLAGFRAANRLVEASEALRGQFGKRSPNGLDARLDAYEGELASLLDETGLGDEPNALELLCTPGEPHLSAESTLLQDLARAQRAFPEPPTLEHLSRAEPGRAEAVWVFLRRHAKWSLAQLGFWYEQLSGELLRDQGRAAARRRNQMAQARHDLMIKIGRVASLAAQGRIHDLSTAMTLLNHLNLSLEPSFSFKGGLGLAHDLVFRMGEEAVDFERASIDTIRAKKWVLFATADLSSRMEAHA
ncbi:hypothetical protein M9M90_01020 [Phenylobacterium sp. LH3H17]|uniref:hypothetical protein n=1 Tax=Phenylobacterium sp. LH3H17 TaxID=2903901 RepID=UPI0020C9F11A|nr:hypothetical protein [Phenylobacterium sp. LH3H17]UTP39786.1 hypothetical protein M9M90_01020 [Phenylobacterium sp. LH3H17]